MDSQAAIDGLRSCASSIYTNSRFYYKTKNFELWASIECCIRAKHLSVLPVKVKGHDGNYWNEFANSLANSAQQHYTFKFKLFLDELPLLEKLKITRPDLYIDLLTCRSCCNRKEDLLHLILCSKRCNVMHQILQSYQNHLFSKLRAAGELADVDPTPMLRKLSSLSCWNISSSNWSSYAFIQGCLPSLFIDLFVELSIPRVSAMKVVAAIHNNFIHKLRTRIWNPHTYDKSKWEDVMNITLKLKTTPRPSNLPATSYVPFFSLPPLTQLVTSRDSGTNWIKNSMTLSLP
ncbi:hypothetical protein RclHR1_16730002 [Rhizophagus clarus]|uniref:Uncharacterized protein n=1 Tax=Rhizophagus clarus TaxID=94130 RepID=A0A2Z6QJP4_9GLOM|nr:hypothetical protein RclHR1_16730002 [Rhizophagus clarus]